MHGRHLRRPGRRRLSSIYGKLSRRCRECDVGRASRSTTTRRRRPKPDVSVLPGNHRVALTWASSQYVAEVVRLSKASAQAVVYRGASGSLHRPASCRNGRRYRYGVTLTDQAGNSAPTARTSAVPTSSQLLLPADGARLTRGARARLEAPSGTPTTTTRSCYDRGRKVLTRWPVHQQAPAHRALELARAPAPPARRGATAGTSGPASGRARDRNYGRLLGSSCFTG